MNVPQPGPERLAILIVDDEPDLISSVGRILRLDNFVVETARSNAELLNRADLATFFAILLDRKLPDGLSDESLPILRHRAPNAKILIVTGYADLKSSIVALRNGVEDYLIKPIEPDELRMRLARLVESRRKDEALQALHNQLLQTERLAAIGEAMTGLTHESRNALQRCQSCLDLLAVQVQHNADGREFVHGIQSALDDLQRLYEEVRQYAAPIRLECESQSLQDIVRRSWQELAPARAHRVTQMRELAESDDLRCDVDPFQLGKVFRNLFENSLAACTDPVEMTIRYRAIDEQDQPALQVFVRDNGPGLNVEQQRRVFDSFYTTKTKGTGLGMAIVRRIVEAHDGQIAVNPNCPAGAEFVLTIPRRRS